MKSKSKNVLKQKGVSQILGQNT